jgi:hypothetical protein
VEQGQREHDERWVKDRAQSALCSLLPMMYEVQMDTMVRRQSLLLVLVMYKV